MWKRLTALLAALLLLGCCCAAEDGPAYPGTERFVRALESKGMAYELLGVDEDGDECVLIMSGDNEIYCYFDEACTSASYYVWYLATYDNLIRGEVLRACSRLNASSLGVCFTADDSDCTVTAAMDVLLREGTAGEVALDALLHLMAMLPEAERALDIPRPAVTPPPVAPMRRPVTSPAATVQPHEVKSVVITAEMARIRSGPSGTSPYLLTAKQGDVFDCMGQSGNWYIIDCNGRAGFVSKSAAEPR